jgi:phosphohistidine phosphatase
VGFAPDMVVTSPRLRSSQTADLVAAALGQKVRLEPRLAAPLGLAELERLLDELGSPRRPLLVGHDPDFSGLVTALVGGAEITLRKGALARLDATRPLAPGGGALRWLLPPELLGRD